jgi:hypothetical protein
MALPHHDVTCQYQSRHISSKELGACFAQAGFVFGCQLAKQKPHLMINMGSILSN